MNRYNYRQNNDLKNLVRILVSFIIIALSIGVIIIVVKKTMSIRIMEKISLKEDKHDSINITTDLNSGTSFFVTDDAGIKYRKEDKSFAREEWIEKNGELFYFDTAGYGLNKDLKLEGQVYTFENGKLISIKRDTSYVKRAVEDLYSSIKTQEYILWLVNDEKEKGFFPIKYRNVNEEYEDYLGTKDDKQYASPNMIKIYTNYVYFLAVGKGTDFAGRLYRMRPGATHKETVGVGVTGFIVLSDDVVYYSDGNRVMKAKSWKGIELNIIDEESETSIDVNESSDIVPIIDGKIQESHKDENNEVIKNNIKEENEDTNKIILGGVELPIPDVISKIVETSVNSYKETSRVVKEEKVEVGVGPIPVEVGAPE